MDSCERLFNSIAPQREEKWEEKEEIWGRAYEVPAWRDTIFFMLGMF